MVKTRKSSGRGKQKSAPSKTAGADSKSKTRVRGGAKKTKKKWSPISDTSPFKGFDHSQPLAQNKENIKGRKLFDDGLAEDENNTFDRLLDPNYKSRFRNIRTYTNKKKVAHESRLLEFQDCKNRESIIRWLNDTHNVFDRLTQTQCDSVRNDDNEVPLTLDMPSVSQMDMSKSNRFNNRNTQTRRSPYRLRARSLNIQIKKNSSVGRSKRYSLAGDTPSMENYYIEEVVTDEEAPIPAEKIIVDLMEDEYLDNIEKAMLQSDSEKKSQKGWDRIKHINKTINSAKKKPRQLKITTLQCSQNKKNLVDSYPTFNLDDLENYFIENMEKVMNVSRQDAYVSTTQQGVDVQTFSLQDVINTGNNLILMLRKLLGRDDLTELQPMLSNMKEIFTGLNLSRNQMRKASTQTLILENMDKELQTEANVTSVEVQTEDLYKCQNCANNNIVIKNNVLPDLVLSDKIVQTEDRMNSLEIQSNNDSQNYAKNHQKLVRISTTSSTASNLSMTEQMERIATPVSNCSLNKTLDDVCFNTEDAVRGGVGQNDQLESLDICFNTEDILRKEGNQNDVKNESGGSKGVKRLLPKSPPRDSEGLQSKRPCNKFINDDLTIDFMSCTERGRRRAPDEEVIQLSEDSDEAQFDVMKKYGKNLSDKAEDKAAPKTSKTQEDVEQYEDMIRNATKPLSSAVPDQGTSQKQPSWPSSDSDVVFIEAELNMSKLEKDFDYFKTEKTPKKSRRCLFDSEDNRRHRTPEFSESLFFSDNEDNAENLGNRTITQDNVDDVMRAINRDSASADREVDEEMRSILPQENVKVNILQNVVIKSAGNRGGTDDETASETSDDNFFSDVDIVESTPQKKIGSFAERRAESVLDITLPPPVEFQDVETTIKAETDGSKKIPSPPRRPLASINKITSTPMTQNYATEKLSLSPISLDNNRILGPIEIHQKSKFSPLTIVKKTQSQRSLHGTPKQKSILSYIRPSQESQETPPSLTGRPCIACSRVARDQVMAISALTNKKLASYSSSFSSKVTHLIVSVDGRNRIKDHTIKSVSAIAAGIWVLSYGWVRECLARNCLVPEEPYEVLDISGAPGPKLARLNRRTNPLLKDFKVHVLPPFQSATKSDLENILRMLGAKVVDSLEDLLDKENYICLVIGDRRPTEECPVDMFDGVVEVFRVITVDVDWLSRSVGQYTLHGLRPFTLCSEDNIDDLEYPPELLSNNVQISFLPSTSSVPSL